MSDYYNRVSERNIVIININYSFINFAEYAGSYIDGTSYSDYDKKLTIILSIFPGSLFILALLSLIICAIAELGLPGGSANIGLGLLFIAFVINIPTIIVWILYIKTRGSNSLSSDSKNK